MPGWSVATRLLELHQHLEMGLKRLPAEQTAGLLQGTVTRAT